MWPDRFEYGGWVIAHDAAETRRALSGETRGGADLCGCSACRNWIALRLSFPKTFLEVLANLGIPVDRDAEVYHMCRLPSGRHSYGAWYHLIGVLVEAPPDGTRFSLGEGLEAWFQSPNLLSPVAPELAGRPVVQLEIVGELPWLLAEPELE